MADPTTKLTLALATSAIGTGISAVGAMQQGKAQAAQARYQAAVARNNQIIAQRSADDARRRGKIEADIQRDKSRALVEQQRSALAGAGVLVGQDSALETVINTAGLGELDALTIQSNAEREALGFEAQGSNFAAESQLAEMEARNARTSGMFKAGATLMSGFGSVATKWYVFNKLDAD